MHRLDQMVLVEIAGFRDDFDTGRLDRERWLPNHLPHWSSRSASRARYRFTDHSVVLFIADDQAPWCPEFDGAVRVSALQSGCFAGPLGSQIGQHRFTPNLVVREEQPTLRLGLCRHGAVELRCRAGLTETAVASLYLIGFEDAPDESGEITVMEVFGHGVHDGFIRLGRGVKAISDPTLVDEFSDDPVDVDLGQWHTYRIDWRDDGIDFFCDDRQVFTTSQVPDYPMQMMLTLYELHTDDGEVTNPFWPFFEIDHVSYEPPSLER